MRARAGERWRLAATAVLLALAVLAALPGIVLRGETLVLRDTALYFWPTKDFLARAIQAGELPFWLPSASNGQPFLANPKNSLLYPPQALFYLLLPARAAFHGLVLLHLFALGLGASCWLRKLLGLTPLAAAAGALALILSGFILSSIEFHQHLLALAWMPAVLLLADAVGRDPSPGRRGALALAVALLLLAGEPYVALVTLGLLAIQAAVRTPPPRRAAAVAALAPALLAGALLAAPQIVPAALHLPRTDRIRADFAAQDRFALPPARLLELALPTLHGTPDRLDGFGHLVFGEQLHVSIHAGTLVLCALFASLAGRHRWLVLGLAAAGLALAALPGAETLTSIFPLSLVRYRSKYALLFYLGASIAMAASVDGLARGQRGVGRALAFAGALAASCGLLGLLLAARWSPGLRALAAAGMAGAGEAAVARASQDLTRLALLGLLALLAALLGRAGRGSLAAILLAAAAGAELAALAPAVNPTFPLHAVADPGPLVSAAGGSAGRLWREPAAASSRLARLDESSFWEAARSVRTARALSALPWGVRLALDEDYDQMYLADARRTWERADASRRRRLLALAGVSLILADAPPFAGLEPVATDGFSAASLYALPGAVPLLRAVRGLPAASADERLRLALSEGFDPLSEAAIEGLDASAAAGPAQVRLEVREERADRLAVAARAGGPCWLVWSLTPAPGWRARIDGGAAPIHLADAGALAVAIGAGEHLVEFEYRPPGLRAGLGLALAAAGYLLIPALRRLVRARAAR